MKLGSDINGKILEQPISYSNSIKISIKNLVWANQLDVLEFDPTKGIGLSKYIGQPLDDITIYNIRASLTRMLTKYETRISNLNIDISINTEYNGIIIKVYYQELFTGLLQELILNYEI